MSCFPTIARNGPFSWRAGLCLLLTAISLSAAPLTPEQQKSLEVLDREFARANELLPTATDPLFRENVAGSLGSWKGKAEPLRTSFDQVLYDEVMLAVFTEYQRIVASKNPPKLLPLQAPAPPPTPPVDLPGESYPLPPLSPPESAPAPLPAAGSRDMTVFLEQHCTFCHDSAEKKGGLDLESLAFKPEDPENLDWWTRVHDRVSAGEMPPKKRKRPDPADLEEFLAGLSSSITTGEQQRVASEGRASQRRLNAYEYENSLRDLFNLPWLLVKSGLPDDGISSRFNKSGKALDISHVQLSRFMGLADRAIREAVSVKARQIPTTTRRLYARDQKFLIKEYKQVVMNTWPDRQNFPILGTKTETDVRLGKAPLTVGDSDMSKRDLEAVAWLGIAFPKWDRTPIPVSGRYKIRMSGYTIWASPNGYSGLIKPEETERIRRATRWHLPDIDNILPGRRNEPVAIYAEAPGQNRRIGEFNLTPEPGIYEIEAWIGEQESIMPRANRLYYPRPPMPTNPHAQTDGAPGVAFRWMDIEGPLHDEKTTAGYRLMFGDLPLEKFEKGGKEIVIRSEAPKQDAERLLRGFLKQAYRQPADESEFADLLKLIHSQLDLGVDFAEAMIVGYTAALAAPGFLVLAENPGPLDGHALASRLSFFLWNSPPDAKLRELGGSGEILKPEVLRTEAERLLADPKAKRFVEAFLDYWLDLRKMEDTSPSITLYNDYYLDDALIEASLAEPRLFFADLLKRNLPARNIVDSDFSWLNERLARHYGIPGIEGIGMRRVAIPPESPRGGLLTQAAVLKVTANGTTTSPVLRGHWITERILGVRIPPPPPVNAIEPDIRGAVTIRQQLEKHRENESCASCHNKMDPPGFALENFDVFGGWRDHYRAISPDKQPVNGFGQNGTPFLFHQGLPVDSAGSLPDGREFTDIHGFKRLLLENTSDEEKIARNLVSQLIVYATGAPVGFSDRPAVDRILERTREGKHGVRHIVHEIIQSHLFRNK